MKEDYYIYSRRYGCKKCAQQLKAIKVKANVPAAQAVAVGVSAETVGLRASVAAAAAAAQSRRRHSLQLKIQLPMILMTMMSASNAPSWDMICDHLHGHCDDYPAFHTHQVVLI